MSHAINTFCDKILKKAKSVGLEECEVYGVMGSKLDVGIEKGEIASYTVNDSTGVSFRAKIDGKMGYASTTCFDDLSIDMLINKSIENARIIEDEDMQFIFSGSEEYQTPTCYNKEIEQVTTADIIALAKDMEKYALDADPRVKQVQRCKIITRVSFVVLKNSKGLNLAHNSNSIFAICAPVVECNGISNNAYNTKNGFHISEIDAKQIAESAVNEAILLCLAKSIPSGKYNIIFRNDCFAALFATFSSIFSADLAQKGLSLLNNKVGDSIASNAFTLIDDGLMPWGFSSRGFDDEGVAVFTKPIIQNGVLKTLLHNLKTAQKAGVITTGNGKKGSYSSPISISGNNMVIQCGEKDLTTLTQTMNNGIILTELNGLHSGANTISGDFSLSAKGFLVSNGAIEKAISGITVSGNFYDLLKDIKEVGSDVYTSPQGRETIYTPSVLCGELSIAGSNS